MEGDPTDVTETFQVYFFIGMNVRLTCLYIHHVCARCL